MHKQQSQHELGKMIISAAKLNKRAAINVCNYKIDSEDVTVEAFLIN